MLVLIDVVVEFVVDLLGVPTGPECASCTQPTLRRVFAMLARLRDQLCGV